MVPVDTAGASKMEAGQAFLAAGETGHTVFDHFFHIPVNAWSPDRASAKLIYLHNTPKVPGTTVHKPHANRQYSIARDLTFDAVKGCQFFQDSSRPALSDKCAELG